MISSDDTKFVIDRLKDAYPEVKCALEFKKPHELLFATRLSAQCTDVRVNMVTPRLFLEFDDLEKFSNAPVERIEDIIKSCGLYKTKARDIKEAATRLVTEFNGEIPDDMDRLLTLPGVGRKTANLILGELYNIPAVIADTHCIRLSNRLDFVEETKDAFKVECALKKAISEGEQTQFCHRLVTHGRAVCSAKKPKCNECIINLVCKFFHNNS